MKFTIYVIIFLSLFTACSQGKEIEEKGDAVIKKADLTDFEEKFLDITNNHALVYDIEVKNDDILELRATVDYYENSELVTTIVDFSTSLSESNKEEPIRTVFMQHILGENLEHWIATVLTNSGQSNTKNDLERREQMSAYSYGEIVSPTSLVIGEKKVIASIVQTNKSVFSSRSDITTEEELKEATNYEQVYIISIELNE